MMRTLSKLLISTFVGWGMVSGVTAAPVYDYGCLASSGSDVHERHSTQGLGPIFERSDRGGTNRFTAVRPFFTHEFDDRNGKETLDVFWPIGHFSWWFNQTDWRILTAFYHDPDTADPTSAYRFWLLPLYAKGRSSAGEEYSAFFPIYGRMDDWFGRDRVKFVLFPLYWHSELNDLRTDHYLWPFISRTTGNDVYRFRVFPFYARSEKRGVGENRSILWPFWSTARYDRPGSRGSGYVLFPIYGHSKTEQSETWMFIPPFFRHTTGKAGTENIILWPFIQTQKSKAREKVYVWPLYGRRTTEQENRRFWLWPFIWNRTETERNHISKYVRVFPFYDSESTRLKTPDKPVVDRYVSIWPLGSYERVKDDYKRFRFLDLWPFRDTKPIERNLTPWWTLYKYERTPAGRENTLLWGLVHWGAKTNGASYASVFPVASWGRGDQAGTQKSWDFLKGMVGYRHDEEGTKWRLLYYIQWRNRP